MYVYTMTTTEILASALRPGHVLVNFDGETETVTAVEIADGEVFLITTTRSDDLPLGVHAVVTVLTPTAVTDLAVFDRLKGVVMSLGADMLVLSAADHDRLVAVVSHVPHLVAATLMNAASAGAEEDGALLRLAAGG